MQFLSIQKVLLHFCSLITFENGATATYSVCLNVVCNRHSHPWFTWQASRSDGIQLRFRSSGTFHCPCMQQAVVL